MESVKQYLLCVICGAIVCALVEQIALKKGATGAVLKLVSSVFLAYVMVSPIVTLELGELTVYREGMQEDAADAAAMGQSYRDEALHAIIKAETEAYILDKATVLQADVNAEVTLDENLQPESVTLSGEVNPYAKLRLESIITEDLGIAKENQQWNE